MKKEWRETNLEALIEGLDVQDPGFLELVEIHRILVAINQGLGQGGGDRADCEEALGRNGGKEVLVEIPDGIKVLGLANLCHEGGEVRIDDVGLKVKLEIFHEKGHECPLPPN